MAKMLKQAQDMQNKIEDVQAELSDILIDADSGGGMVKIKIKHLTIFMVRVLMVKLKLLS